MLLTFYSIDCVAECNDQSGACCMQSVLEVHILIKKFFIAGIIANPIYWEELGKLRSVCRLKDGLFVAPSLGLPN